MSNDGLSEEEIARIVREISRQNAEEQKRVLSSKGSLEKFLEDVGLFYLMRKIGDVFDWLLKIFF